MSSSEQPKVSIKADCFGTRWDANSFLCLQCDQVRCCELAQTGRANLGRSRSHPAPAVREVFAEHQAYRNGYDDGARKACEDVLTLIEKWIKEDACPPGKKKGKRCDKGCAMCFVESLRSPQQQAGEP